MIIARATCPSPTHPNGPCIIILALIKNDNEPNEEHRATVSDGSEDPKTLRARWEAIANALIDTGLNLGDQMVREAWFASICLTNNRMILHIADRARDIVSGRIGPERLREIYETAA